MYQRPVIHFFFTYVPSLLFFFFFFFNDPAPTEIYPLPLHDALPIPPPAFASAAISRLVAPATIGLMGRAARQAASTRRRWSRDRYGPRPVCAQTATRSEEHTSELQSQSNLVCRLLLEKKKKKKKLTH